MSLKVRRNLPIAAAALLVSILGGSPLDAAQQPKKHPVYVSFFIHCESSPIRGVPVDVQYEPYSGEGMVPRNKYLDKLLDLCERYKIKFEFATTPLFAQQLREDRPELIERIKRMKIPISRYPSIAGHVLPPPIGEMRQMPGMLLHQLRNRETGWEQYIENEWLAESRTLVPGWHFEGDRVVVQNPRTGAPITLEELPEYRIPKEERRLYGGVLALEEVFGVIPLPTFPPLFQGDSTRFDPTPVQRGLGMNSFRVSAQPFKAFNAPFQAGNAKMLTWFKEHFPVDLPLNASASFGYTHDFQGRYIGLSLHEDLIRYIVEHPDEYKIVWPDPDAVQYRPENSPIEFFKKTYGVSSLREVREMSPPVAAIRRIDRSVPIREVTRSQEVGRTGWQKEMLLTLSELGITGNENLPDFLRPRTEWVRQQQVMAAAKDLLARTQFKDGLGELPLQVQAGGEQWTLSKAFVAMVSWMEQFALYDRLPAGLALTVDVLGPVEYPYKPVAGADQLDAQVGRLQGVPKDPHINEVNLLQASWETAELLRKGQMIPARVPVQLSAARAGNYSGRPSQLSASEFLYAMAEELVLLEKSGLPDGVPFKRLRMLPGNQESSAPGWRIEQAWTKAALRQPVEKSATREECLETANYVLAAWTIGNLGHTEDIGGPPYGITAGGGKWSLNQAFQALAYSLMEWRKTGKLPEKVAIREVLGPLDYPMYELRTEPSYNVRLLRGGWQPYQIDVRDFPAPDLINVQGLPGPGHGGYEGFLKPDPLLASVQAAVERLRTTGIIPGSVAVELPQGRKYPGATAPHAYINSAELLWSMAQLYRFIAVLGKPDDVFLRSCRMIREQLHAYVTGFSPVGFTRSTYRYRRDSFDWIEQVPAWRIERAWAYAGQ